MRGLRNSAAAASRFDIPVLTRRAICRSWGVSSAVVDTSRLRAVSPEARSSRRARSGSVGAPPVRLRRGAGRTSTGGTAALPERPGCRHGPLPAAAPDSCPASSVRGTSAASVNRPLRGGVDAAALVHERPAPALAAGLELLTGSCPSPPATVHRSAGNSRASIGKPVESRPTGIFRTYLHEKRLNGHEA